MNVYKSSLVFVWVDEPWVGIFYFWKRKFSRVQRAPCFIGLVVSEKAERYLEQELRILIEFSACSHAVKFWQHIEISDVIWNLTIWNVVQWTGILYVLPFYPDASAQCVSQRCTSTVLSAMWLCSLVLMHSLFCHIPIVICSVWCFW